MSSWFDLCTGMCTLRQRPHPTLNVVERRLRAGALLSAANGYEEGERCNGACCDYTRIIARPVSIAVRMPGDTDADARGPPATVCGQEQENEDHCAYERRPQTRRAQRTRGDRSERTRSLWSDP